MGLSKIYIHPWTKRLVKVQSSTNRTPLTPIYEAIWHGPKEWRFYRHGPWNMLTQAWKFQSSTWSRSKTRAYMVTMWSKNGPHLVPKRKSFIDIGLRLNWPSLENFAFLISVEVGKYECPISNLLPTSHLAADSQICKSNIQSVIDWSGELYFIDWSG